MCEQKKEGPQLLRLGEHYTVARRKKKKRKERKEENNTKFIRGTGVVQ
jgi:hypothetical protein